MPAPTLTSIKPFIGKLGDIISLVGTGFVETPKSKVYKRKHGETEWETVNTANVTWVSATSITVTLAAGDAWDGGFNDIGVSESTASIPDASLAQALSVYTAGADNPDNVIVGAVEGVYVDGLYMGDLADETAWELTEEINKIFTQHSRAPVKTYPGETTCELTIPLAEASLENFQVVLGAPDIEDLGGDRRRLTFGGRDVIGYSSILLIVPGPTGLWRAIGFYRANVGFAGSVTIGKDTNMQIPMAVTVLEDTSRAVGDRMGCFEDYPMV